MNMTFGAQVSVNPNIGNYKTVAYERNLQKAVERNIEAFEQLPADIDKVEFRLSEGADASTLGAAITRGSDRKFVPLTNQNVYLPTRKRLDLVIQQILDAAKAFSQSASR